MPSNISVTFSNQSSQSESIRKWLRLEEYPMYTSQNAVTLEDLDNMVAMAASGLSATRYKKVGCPVSVTDEKVTIVLPFYVWPSSPDLNFNISSQWKISEKQAVIIEREGSVVIPLSKEFDMPFYVEGFSYTWETEAYNKFGELVEKPTLSLTNGYHISLDSEVFGVVRMHYMAYGYLFYLTAEFENVDNVRDTVSASFSTKPIVNDSNPNTLWKDLLQSSASEYTDNTPDPLVPSKVTNVNATVTATYIDENGDEQTEDLELQVPDCVMSYLNPCEDGSITWQVAGEVVDSEKGRPLVYYSTCTGNVLAVKYEKNE